MEQPNNPNPEEETYEEEEACCYCTMLDDELEMRDNIREVVVHRMAIYEEQDLAKIFAFLAMFPAFATVEEVVHSIKKYIDEVEND